MPPRINDADVYIGTAGWSYDDWKGIFYPRPEPDGFRPLSYLSRYFNTVELNNTFYRPPKPGYCHRWLKEVEGREDFSFTAKLWRRFTHEREEPWSREDVDTFREGIAPLVEAGRLGALLVQFPWSFRYTEGSRRWVGRLVEQFADLPLVLEVRSREWVKPKALNFVRALGVGLCNIDQPRFRGNIPLTAHAFGPVGYLRLHGRNRENWFSDDAGRDERYDYLYDGGELDEIEDAARRIAERVERLYLVANNHYRGQAPANALQLFERLSGQSLTPPEQLAREYDL